MKKNTINVKMIKFTPIKIDGIIYKTKKSLHEKRKEITKKTMLNEKQEIILINENDVDVAHKVFKINDLNHLAFINGLYEYHPKFLLWSLDNDNTPIDFFVGNYGPKGEAFFVQTKTKAWVFSAIKCIDGDPSHNEQVIKAFRNAITPQIIDFRRKELAKNGKFISAISGLEIDPDVVEIDHHNPQFATLVAEWLQLKKFEDTISLKVTGTGLDIAFENGDELKSWYDFHLKRANLRITSKSENATKAENRIRRI